MLKIGVITRSSRTEMSSGTEYIHGKENQIETQMQDQNMRSTSYLNLEMTTFKRTHKNSYI